jgi:ubiquinone/menaquinone biosynthesis C-methylase UbiE
MDPGLYLILGGGDGRLAISLVRRYPQLRRVVSADISRDMTRRAAQRALRLGLADRIAAEMQDVHCLKYADSSFDVVVSFGALHHWREPAVGLTEAYRVLRPGGWLCILDGYDRPTFRAIRHAVGSFGGTWLTAVAYWLGSKDTLSRDRVQEVYASVALPAVSLVFNDLLLCVCGLKPS